jgi:hypothetical protein
MDTWTSTARPARERGGAGLGIVGAGYALDSMPRASGLIVQIFADSLSRPPQPYAA